MHSSKKWLQMSIVVLVFFSLSTGEVISQIQSDGTGRITGKVTEYGSEKPIKNAKVKYKYASQSNYESGTYTNDKGTFLTNVLRTNAVVKLIISAKGYVEEYEEAIVTNGMYEINISLKERRVVPERLKFERRDFKIHYGDTEEIFKLLQPTLNSGSHPSYSKKLRTISINARPPELERIEMLILQYDMPLKQIWLEVTLIQATGNGDSKPQYPKEIAGVVKKLRSLFKFGKYTIIGRADAMGLEGSKVSISSSNNEQRSRFSMDTVLGYNDDIIRLENLRVMVIYPQQSELATTANVKNGETVILGASGGDAQEGSLITVVKAKVMN